MADFLGEHLLETGLIQFGYFEEGKPYRLNFHLLPAYPDILQLLARKIIDSGLLRDADRILCDSDSTPFAGAVSLMTQIPLVYSRPDSDLPIGAYDVGHPAVILVNCFDNAQKLTRLIHQSRRVGLNVNHCIAFVLLHPTNPPDVDSLINFPTLIDELVADGRLPIRQGTAVKTWLATLHPDSAAP